jgi:hypothetical protein
MGVMNKLWEQASDVLNNELIQPVVLVDGTLKATSQFFSICSMYPRYQPDTFSVNIVSMGFPVLHSVQEPCRFIAFPICRACVVAEFVFFPVSIMSFSWLNFHRMIESIDPR